MEGRDPDARTPVASAFWQRLDAPGHDACRLERDHDAWILHGGAVFQDERGPAALDYRVECSRDWVARRGEVRGFVGARDIALLIVREPDGRWTLNGSGIDAVSGLLDLDFGFTPATNLPHLRRVAIEVGQSVDLPVAWLDVSTGALSTLPQRYEHRDARSYWYEAPTVGYRGLLTFQENGFIEEYAGLWRTAAASALR